MNSIRVTKSWMFIIIWFLVFLSNSSWQQCSNRKSLWIFSLEYWHGTRYSSSSELAWQPAIIFLPLYLRKETIAQVSPTSESTVKNSDGCHGFVFIFLYFILRCLLQNKSLRHSRKMSLTKNDRRKREEKNNAEFKDWNVLLLPHLIAYADSFNRSRTFESPASKW